MHDPTEGGIATAVHEIVHAANLGALIEAEMLTIFPETQMLCDHYYLDPLGLIASGALLISRRLGGSAPSEGLS
jgi:hydrogenase maturation factor